MSALLLSVFAASLVGGLHCVGMCGAFVAFYTGDEADLRLRRRAQLHGHLAYNFGRLMTYSALGVAAGSLGAAVDLAGDAAGWARSAAVLSGALMIVWGSVVLAQQLGLRLPAAGSAVTQRLTQRLLRWWAPLSQKPPLIRAGLIGALTTLLPCGWLYAFALIAASTASPWRGGLVMATFWLGTVPWLLGLGALAQGVVRRLRVRIPAVTAVMLVTFGLLGVMGRLAPGLTEAEAAAPTPVCHGAPAATD